VGDAEKEAIMSARGRSAPASGDKPSLRPAIVWGVIVGVVQVASPFAFWWLDAATVYALGLAAIAFVYIGFAVADGRSKVIGIEATVAMVFVVAAAIGITGSAWLLVVGFAGHGLKDAWQHRTRFVLNTRWWPPFCAAVDWVVAVAIAIAIVAGANLQR
jgi:hypothetical protein